MTDFADSNVLIYAILEDDPRCEAARDVLRTGPATGVQALNEFVWMGRRKFGLDVDDLRAGTAFLQALLGPVHSLSLDDHNGALQLSARYRFQWWDSLLLAVALRTGASRFLSEDLQHGQVIEDRLTLINPFRGTP